MSERPRSAGPFRTYNFELGTRNYYKETVTVPYTLLGT